MYFLDVNSKHAPTQVETVLTIASEALIGNPTIVTNVLKVETPLTKATELAPVDACTLTIATEMDQRWLSDGVKAGSWMALRWL